MKKYSGSCLCASVAFEITGEFRRFLPCHCGRCRKETGSAHAANLFSTPIEFTWVRGEETVRTFRLPNTRFVKSFCVTCGSALPTVEANGTVVVPAGSLD